MNENYFNWIFSLEMINLRAYSTLYPLLTKQEVYPYHVVAIK